MRTNPFSDALDFLTQGEWTSYVFALLALASVVIAAVTAATDSALARSFFSAVVITPVPSGLVNSKTSPSRAPTLRQMR